MRILISIAVVGAALVMSAPTAHAGAEFTWGLRLGTPQLVSGSAGFLIGPLDAPKRPADAPPPTKMYIPRGLLVQAEPGVGGGKIGVGYAKGLPNVAAAGIKAFYLRTWGQPLFVDRNRNYVGIEGDATLFMKLSLGVMRSVGDGPRDIAVTGGVGIGF
jgi:hypothetical protein